MAKRDELTVAVEELVALLAWAGDAHWRDWMLRVLERLKKGDDSGADLLLAAYGGMGSFNDFGIGKTCVREGRVAWEPGHKERSDRFEELREKAWRLATDQIRGRTALDRWRMLSPAERRIYTLSALFLLVVVLAVLGTR
jgi:hypothetical protein